MAHKRVNDEEVLSGLLDAFRTHGYEGASLAILSEATGLKRASLYHRFPGGKDDMVRAVFGCTGTWYAETIQPILDQQSSPKEKLAQVLAQVEAFYQQGRKSCILEMLGSGAASATFREQLGSSFATWQGLFAQLAREQGFSEQEANRRARNTLALLHGSLVIARGTQNHQVFVDCLQEFPESLLGLR